MISGGNNNVSQRSKCQRCYVIGQFIHHISSQTKVLVFDKKQGSDWYASVKTKINCLRIQENLNWNAWAYK